MKAYRTAFGILAVVLVVNEALFLGADVANHLMKDSIVDGILLTFWIFALVLFHIMTVREAADDASFDTNMSHLERLGDMLKSLKEDKDENDAHHEELSAAFKKIVKDVVSPEKFESGELPSDDEVAEIKKRFEAETDHVVNMKEVGGKMAVVIDKDHSEDE